MTAKWVGALSIVLCSLIVTGAMAHAALTTDGPRVGSSPMGPRVGNGGGAWLCRDQETQDIRWMRLTDLFEATVEFDFKLQKFKGLSHKQIYIKMRKDIFDHVPVLNDMIRKHVPSNLDDIITPMDKQGVLTVVNDGLYYVRPDKGTCTNGFIYFGQIANFTDDNRLLISEWLWGHSKFSELDRAALLIHEIVYKALREAQGDRNSRRTRQIVAILFSTHSAAERAKRIEDVLKSPPPAGEESQVNLDTVRLVCSARVEKDGQKTPAKSEVLVRKNGGFLKQELKPFKFTALTDPTDGKPLFMQIEDENSGASAVLDSHMLMPAFLENRPILLTLRSKATRESAVLNCWTEANAK